jgi:O-antigen/teichoic acid export membrane protein
MSHRASDTALQRELARHRIAPGLAGALILALAGVGPTALSLALQNGSERMAPGLLLFPPVTILFVLGSHLLLTRRFLRSVEELRNRTVLEDGEFSTTLEESNPLRIGPEVASFLLAAGVALLLGNWPDTLATRPVGPILLAGAVVAIGLTGWLFYSPFSRRAQPVRPLAGPRRSLEHGDGPEPDTAGPGLISARAA